MCLLRLDAIIVPIGRVWEIPGRFLAGLNVLLNCRLHSHHCSGYYCGDEVPWGGRTGDIMLQPMRGSRRACRIVGAVVLCALLLTIVLYSIGGLMFTHRNEQSMVCLSRLDCLGFQLRRYAREHEGRFPPAGWDRTHSCPLWVQALRESWSSKDDNLDRELKCPNDRSSSITSYELDRRVAGRRLADIPEKDWWHTTLVSEKPFLGNHGWSYSLSGRYTHVRHSNHR